MRDIELLEQLGVMIAGAAFALLLLRRLRVPAVVIYIGIGLLLGSLGDLLPGGSGVHGAASHSLEVFSEAGIVLLLFLVGLELNVATLRDLGRPVLIAGLCQVSLTAVTAFALTRLTGFTVLESVFLAIALSFSSTAVVVRLLDEKKELVSLYGRVALGILIVQDLLVVLALTFFAGLGGEAEMDTAMIAKSLGKAFLGTAVLTAIALGFSRKLLPGPFSWAARSTETLFIWSLCWCFLLVVVAEAFSLSAEIGAFLAGLSLAQLSSSHELARRLQPLTSFLIAIFFLSLGANLNFGSAEGYWTAALVLTVFAIAGKGAILLWVLPRAGYNAETSFLASASLAQISEFSFVLAGSVVADGLIGEPILAVVSVVGLVSIAVSSYLLLWNRQIYERIGTRPLFRKLFPAAPPAPKPVTTDELEGHILVVGMNSLGRRIVRELAGKGFQVVAVDTDRAKLRGLPGRCLVGSIDLPRVVEESRLAKAMLVVSALQIEDTNNLLAFRCRQFGVPCAIHAFDRSVVSELERLGVDFRIDPRTQGSQRMQRQINATQRQGAA